MKQKIKIFAGIIIIVFAFGLYFYWPAVKEKISFSVHESNAPESTIFPKNIYYMTAIVVEKRESELTVNGMIPETPVSGREEPRLITKDEKTQVVKILADDYRVANFNDIKKGNKIVVSTVDDFKNSKSVLALTISIYPASKE